MHSQKNKRRAEARAARRRTLRGEVARLSGRRSENLDGHPCTHAAGIDELAVIAVVAEQQPEMRPRSFRVGPADDDKLLAVEPFGFPPKAAVSWRIRGVDRLGDGALKTEASTL
jgi:hypothetical protein